MLVCAMAAGTARAAEFSSGGTFLAVGHGARAHGLGGAAVSLTRDDAAAYWNPANLAWIGARPGVTVMHAELLPEIHHGYDTFTFGRTAGRRLGDPEQLMRPARWGYGVYLSHLRITFESGDWTETAAQLAGAFALNNFASVGAALKGLQLRNDFEAGDANGAGLDVALSLLVTERLSAAVVGRDLWTRIGYDTHRWETLASSIQMGAEYRLRRAWSAEADFVLREGNLQRAMLGVEWLAVRDVLALRGGWTALRAGRARNFPSAGAGVRFGRFELDYGASFDNDDSFGIGQRVSLHIGM
jgi:hypothetical protein